MAKPDESRGPMNTLGENSVINKPRRGAMRFFLAALFAASAGLAFGDEFLRLLEVAAPQFAVTPGQSVVIYESRVCLGGGIIQAAV